MNRYAALAASSALLLSPATLLAQGAALPTPAFVKTAAQTDQFEREEGRLAEARAANVRVKDFGREMVTAHTKTTAALKAAVAKAGLPPPAPPTLSRAQTSDLATLRGLHGTAFDKAYIAQQIQTHQTALGVMRAYAAAGGNAVIRKAAADTAPIVQSHLTMAEQLK